jgi:hypothetical protein
VNRGKQGGDKSEDRNQVRPDAFKQVEPMHREKLYGSASAKQASCPVFPVRLHQNQTDNPTRFCSNRAPDMSRYAILPTLLDYMPS